MLTCSMNPMGQELEEDILGETLAEGYAARLGACLDTVADDEAQLAMRAAHRASAIDEARSWAQVSDEFVLVNSTMSAAERTEWVMRIFVSEVATRLHLPQPTASHLIDESRALVQELPGTLAALTAGAFSYRHAQVIIDQAKTLPVAAREAFEQELLADAGRLPVTQFRRKAVATRERMHPESIVVRAQKAKADRRLAIDAAQDGMAWLSLFLPAPEAFATFDRVTAVAKSLQCPEEGRTLAQLRCDVAQELLLDGEVIGTDQLMAALNAAGVGTETGTGAGTGNGTGTGSGAAGLRRGRGDKPAQRSLTVKRGRKTAKQRRRGMVPTVIVTVPMMTLLGLGEEPGNLDGYGPIDPDTARRMAGQATSFLRLLTHPETGVPLSLGTEHYRVPRDLKTWLQVRDGTCRFPGCGRAAMACDIDHTVAREHGGPTDALNLAHLCTEHHRLKHASTWKVRQLGGGVLEWTSPTGKIHLTWPAIDLPVSDLSSIEVPAADLSAADAPAADDPPTHLPVADPPF